MAGHQDTKWNRKTDASTEGAAPVAFARQKLPARFMDEISNTTIAPNGACRLNTSTWYMGNCDRLARRDTGATPTRLTLTALTEALPKALTQVDQPLVAEDWKSANALSSDAGL